MSDDDRLWPLYHESELGNLPAPTWLVEDHLVDGFNVLFGKPKTGKTFVALSWAMSIGSGHHWHGHKVRQSPVLYVSGEGVGGLDSRKHAWKVASGVTTSQLYVIPYGARLNDRKHVVGIRKDLHSTGAKLLVIDTLARSMAGADENSSQDMGMVVQALDWLREKTGCAVLVLHHPNAAGENPRGSTALFGAVDMLIRVEGDGSTVDLICDGAKDSPPFRRKSFALTRAGNSVALSPRKVSPAVAGHTPF